jgi:hypothetical protein
MDYTQSQFFRLMETVEDQGGEHLDLACEDRDFEFVGDKATPSPLVRYCGESALFMVPYDPGEAVEVASYPQRHKDDDPMMQPMGRANGKPKIMPGERGEGTLMVCAVDDDMGRWPRFKDQVMD